MDDLGTILAQIGILQMQINELLSRADAIEAHYKQSSEAEPYDSSTDSFGYQILLNANGTSKGDVKIFNIRVAHADPDSTDTDYFTAADTTLTLTANKYNAVYAEYTVQSSITVGVVSGTTIVDALAAVNQTGAVARKTLYVFHRHVSNSFVSLALDCSKLWQIIPTEAP